jgi:hypothetical protein
MAEKLISGVPFLMMFLLHRFPQTPQNICDLKKCLFIIGPCGASDRYNYND